MRITCALAFAHTNTDYRLTDPGPQERSLGQTLNLGGRERLVDRGVTWLGGEGERAYRSRVPRAVRVPRLVTELVVAPAEYGEHVARAPCIYSLEQKTVRVVRMPQARAQ